MIQIVLFLKTNNNPAHHVPLTALLEELWKMRAIFLCNCFNLALRAVFVTEFASECVRTPALSRFFSFFALELCLAFSQTKQHILSI